MTLAPWLTVPVEPRKSSGTPISSSCSMQRNVADRAPSPTIAAMRSHRRKVLVRFGWYDDEPVWRRHQVRGRQKIAAAIHQEGGAEELDRIAPPAGEHHAAAGELAGYALQHECAQRSETAGACFLCGSAGSAGAPPIQILRRPKVGRLRVGRVLSCGPSYAALDNVNVWPPRYSASPLCSAQPEQHDRERQPGRDGGGLQRDPRRRAAPRRRSPRARPKTLAAASAARDYRRP